MALPTTLGNKDPLFGRLYFELCFSVLKAGSAKLEAINQSNLKQALTADQILQPLHFVDYSVSDHEFKGT